MASALVTAILLSTMGLIGSLILGLTAASAADVFRHATLAIFSTMTSLLAHSMTMFYLLGKGKAIREAVQEGGLPGRFVAEVGRLRKPVFNVGTLTMLVTMAAAIVGAGVDTRTIPSGIHSVLGFLAVAANLFTLRLEIAALTGSSRIVAEVNRLLA
jgi:hypothetical protein